jgi:hypothetical protein
MPCAVPHLPLMREVVITFPDVTLPEYEVYRVCLEGNSIYKARIKTTGKLSSPLQFFRSLNCDTNA